MKKATISLAAAMVMAGAAMAAAQVECQQAGSQWRCGGSEWLPSMSEALKQAREVASREHPPVRSDRVLIAMNRSEFAPSMVHAILERDECRRMDVTFNEVDTPYFVLIGVDTPGHVGGAERAMAMVVDNRPVWTNRTAQWTNLAKDLCNCLIHDNCADVRQVRGR